MVKQTVFTTITPLPSYISRDTVVETLHNHKEMVELNPLVINFAKCKPPSFAPADEYHAIWYELTDRISYLPGGILRGNVSYKGCFHDLPRGLHIELGLPEAPREGLYLREDVQMRC